MRHFNRADAHSLAAGSTTKQRGDWAEGLALAHLEGQGLRLLARNFKTPGRGGGEIDLVMQDAGGCCVFVEVRARASGFAGGAAASVTPQKQRRIVLAARHYLAGCAHVPPCRFDVVTVSPDKAAGLTWLKAAFSAD